MRIALLVVAGLALIGFLYVAVLAPKMAGDKEREAAKALLSGAEAAKQQVSAAAEKSGNLAGSGKDVKVADKNDTYGEMKWIVADDGAIRGWNKSNAIEFVMMPTLSGGKVNWTCKGYPVTAMPTTCGGRT